MHGRSIPAHTWGRHRQVLADHGAVSGTERNNGINWLFVIKAFGRHWPGLKEFRNNLEEARRPYF